MWSASRGETSAPLPAGLESGRDLSKAWKNINQGKAALRHIENRLEAVTGSGVVVNSLMSTEKTSFSGGRNARRRERRCVDDSQAAPKNSPHTQRSPDKSSRSPLRASTQDNSSAGRPSSRERIQLHTTYRTLSPPVPSSGPEAALSGFVPDQVPGQHQRADLDSTRSSALDATDVRYLNDPAAVLALRQAQHELATGSGLRLDPQLEDSQMGAPQSLLTSSPGSASLRLEKLRQRQPDEKLEKLKERIRRQREQLERETERERPLGYLEQPLGTGLAQGTSKTVPTAKVRKVAPAPPAPVYKGFNTSEMMICTPDGKVWDEDEFHNLTREIYHDLTQRAERVRARPAEKERAQEKRTAKPVRKVHRSASVPDNKPVINTSSWREGQKLIKMMLGPASRVQSEEREGHADVSIGAQPTSRSRPGSTERPHHPTKDSSQPAGGGRGRKAAVGRSSRGRSTSTDLLSSDIRGILDDLQLGAEGTDGGGAKRRGTGRRGPPPSRWSRSASPPTKTRPDRGGGSEQAPPRKRHYDADSVRQYIFRQQEERKKKQAEERKNQREEAQKKSQRLQELYRKQRGGVAKPSAPPPKPVHAQLQETYTKLLLEHKLQQQKAVYQPSGESDKENKRQTPLSPSNSEPSASEHGPPPLSRVQLDLGGGSSWPHPEHQSHLSSPGLPHNSQLFSQLLSLEQGVAGIAKEASQPRGVSATHTVDTLTHHLEPASLDALMSDLQSNRQSRMETLKARAASLSSRIESEARKLVCLGDNARLEKALSPPVREVSADNPTLRIQRLLHAGQMAFGGDQGGLPGVANLYDFTTAQDEKARATRATPERVQVLDSSGGSISEGPLSEDSISDRECVDEAADAMQDLPKPSQRLGAAEYCPALHNGLALDPIRSFQREAEQLTPFRAAVELRDGRPPWEELTKGSPHSVINVFAKNLHSYSRDLGGESSSALHAPSVNGLPNGSTYEEDFVSSRASSQAASKRAASGLSNGHSTSERRERERSPHHSSTSTPLSSPRSTSNRVSERNLDRSLTDGQRSTSTVSDLQWNGSRKSDSQSGSPRTPHMSSDVDSPAGGASVHSVHSVASEGCQFAANLPAEVPVVSRVSPPCSSPHFSSPPSNRDTTPGAPPVPDSAPGTAPVPDVTNPRTEFRSADLHFAPGVLQQQLTAELSYLGAVEESVRQLSDVERVRAVCLAQQESVSLAQMLKVQQQKHEQELQILRLKTEQEALETQRQLQHIRERTTQMTELAHAQALSVLPSVASIFDQKQPLQQADRSETTPAETPPDSLNESLPSRRATVSGEASSNSRWSPPLSSSVKEAAECRERSSSVEEEEVDTAADESLRADSVHSKQEDRADSVSVATEYSLKFDESVTEDELEKSFRSLLPSESHWRESVERKRSPLAESDEEHGQEKRFPQLSTKDSSMPFTSGEDSFSRFTMAMVRQYMQEEEVRAQHQSSLLRLRNRALKEKTKAELAWLEHQKRRLRDKGEDDKMPPIRKRQRGLLLKLQQEQAEIRRLQEANRAARRERQLLLKQQEDIERMQHTTLRLKEKLRSAGDVNLKSPNSGEMKDSAPPSVVVTDVESRSPSPTSVSGSETSSIMQKLKKMHYHTSERFLTKREQQLVHRRRHAEELLEWRQRLDAEEAVVRRMEEQALATWQKTQHSKPAAPTPQQQPRGRDDSHSHSATTYGQDRATSGEEERDVSSPAQSVSSVHTATWVSEQLVSPSSDGPGSRLSIQQTNGSPHTHCTHTSQEPESTHSHQLQSPLTNCSVTSSSKVAVYRSSEQEHLPSVPTSEATSDQSDIEGRVLVLKEELRRRKAEFQQLKKEQKQRQRQQKQRLKERLKAEEADLIKQLESYKKGIQKTKAELSKEVDSKPAAKAQNKAPATDKARTQTSALQRPETDSQKFESESEKSERDPTESPAESVLTAGEHSEHTDSSDEDPHTVTPSPELGSPDHASGSLQTPKPDHLIQHTLDQADQTPRPPVNNNNQSLPFSQKSEVIKELDYLKSEGSGDQHFFHLKDTSHSLPLFGLEMHLPAGKEEIFSRHEKMVALSTEINHSQDAEDRPEVENVKNRMEFLPKSSMQEGLSPEKSPHESPRKEDSECHKGSLSVSGNGYRDDFETSLDLSSHEDNQGPEPSSPSALLPTAKSYRSSFSHSEEIDEDLSIQSGTTSGSFHPDRPLDLDNLAKSSQRDFIHDVSSPPKSPASPTSRGEMSPVPDEMASYSVGDRVLVSNIQPGTLRFKGQTRFANGFWAGVELDKSEGSNDGTYDGVDYFHCKEGHGIFAPPDKVSHLPDSFEAIVEPSEDEDSPFDDHPNKTSEREDLESGVQKSTTQTKKSLPDFSSERREPSDKPSDLYTKLPQSVITSFATSEIHLDGKEFTFTEEFKEQLPVPNGQSGDIVLELKDLTLVHDGQPIISQHKALPDDLKQEQPVDILDLLLRGKKVKDIDLQKSERLDAAGESESRTLSTITDQILGNFINDAVTQIQQIKKVKAEKIIAANQQRDTILTEDEAHDGCNMSQFRPAPDSKTDNFHTFFDEDHDGVPSPELCNRLESPVLGPSGQEELAKRLEELELSRELLDVLGDEQDWFDEDFGLSFRKEQQKVKQRHQEQDVVPPAPQQAQARVPARPHLPQVKQPEETTMVVPHSSPEVEKLVSAALVDIWKECGLDQGRTSLTGAPKPLPSEAFLNDHSKSDEQEAECVRSYKQAIFDLSWEVIREIYVEEPDANQPLWVKPRRVNSSYMHRFNSANDISKVQAFVTSEVLKLCGLKKDQNNKTDWQKMLKFGRKKRDKVDHILVQELHEEEALWVNYDEDELFVKLQLADGIFDTLLKDTAELLIQIQDKRSNLALC